MSLEKYNTTRNYVVLVIKKDEKGNSDVNNAE